MSDIRERLERLRKSSSSAEVPGKKDLISDLRSRMDRIIKRESADDRKNRVLCQGPGIEELVPGKIYSGETSEFFVAEQDYDTSYLHGIMRLEEIHKESLEVFGDLTSHPELHHMDPNRTLFIDTETTGLSGGTGTYAFMVGVGYFSEERFIVEQFLMRNQAEERDMLTLLSERLAGFRYVVSFNGKSFDLPLLKSRLILSRLQRDVLDLPHLDLLYPSRRIWKRSLESCRLSNLERELLGIERTDDVPGELIPGIYFQYLETGDPSRMERVFYHNRLDILSLVTLTVLIQRRFLDHTSASLEDGLEQYSLGRIHFDQGRLEEAAACFISALEACTYSNHEWEILRYLSLTYKKSDDLSRAVQAWKDMIGMDPERDTFPYIELAKFYEHQEKDYHRAEQYAQRAAAVNPDLKPEEFGKIEHRIQRLIKKREQNVTESM